MSPSKKDKRRAKASGGNGARSAATAVSGWAVAFYKTAGHAVPARQFLVEVPQSVREMLLAIVVAVGDAPPPSFPPSKMWHAMHGRMKGFHEARDEHDGKLYRLFCVVDSQAPEHGLDAKVVALISGGIKPVRTAMGENAYDEAIGYREDYRATRRTVLPTGVPSSLRTV